MQSEAKFSVLRNVVAIYRNGLFLSNKHTHTILVHHFSYIIILIFVYVVSNALAHLQHLHIPCDTFGFSVLTD